MAATARQPKPNRKPIPEPAARRAPAWGGGARNSPTFSPGNVPARLAHSPSPAPSAAGAFPPLAGSGSPAPNGAPARAQGDPDRNLQALAGLTGTTVTITTRSGPRYEGVVASTAPGGDTQGLTLKDARDVNNAGSPIEDQVFIVAADLASWTSGPANAKPANGDSFKTDTDISQLGAPRRERELQAWADDSTGLDLSSRLSGGATSPSGATSGHGHSDELTFGHGASSRGGNAWDQFATNEKLFGVKTGFDEELYTTKLDRSAPDFKERERKAQQIANEIMGGTTSNPHIAEERNQNSIDDSGVNEEDKYGAVVRSTGAYVPPGARKTPVSAAATPTNAAPPTAAVIPKVSVNGPDGAPSPPPSASGANATTPNSAAQKQQPADAVPAFRSFVTSERQRLTQKKQALVKNEMAARMADLMKFSQTFKLNKPMPEDLVQILAKDEDKQKLIRDKSTKDAENAAARAIASPNSAASVSPTPTGQMTSSATANPIKLDAAHAKAGGLPPSVSAKAIAAAPKSATAGKDGKAAADKKANGRPAMLIQAIPAFKGRKAPPPPVTTTAPVPAGPAEPLSPNSARLNVNATSFRPNPGAAAFNPTPTPSPSVTSPPAKLEAPSSPQPNPFFGTKPVKKSNNPVTIRDDFNPFKYNKVADASAVGAIWPYNGKRYSAMYPSTPIPPPAQSSPHMAPPPVVPQQAPPAPYEGDPSQQQPHPGGYVYAYPYGYPGAPMMPGMPPPGPPGPYMAGPYMQPMHYPPHMAPNGQPMYASPQMGQMPPPGPYMAPPPGAYPPPNGAGPRPPMPTTPIPTHAHPYYQPSPQLQHAVPYQMMMAPPGPNVQHPYEGAPQPVQMGGPHA